MIGNNLYGSNPDFFAQGSLRLADSQKMLMAYVPDAE
jgi:hypothetical protein